MACGRGCSISSINQFAVPAGTLRSDVRFATIVRGWIGFVEAASIDWVANPRMTRDQLVELLVQILFEIMKSVPTVLTG